MKVLDKDVFLEFTDDDSSYGLDQAITHVEKCLQAYLLDKSQPRYSESQLPVSEHIRRLHERFDLSKTDIQILLLCVAFELNPSIGQPLSETSSGKPILYPTPHLIWQLLSQSGKKALSPSGALRYWAMVDRDRADVSTAISLLRLDERIFNYVIGVDCLDDRLVDAFEPVQPHRTTLSVSQTAIVDGMRTAFAGGTHIFQLCGTDHSLQNAIASHLCQELQLIPYRLTVEALPASREAVRLLLRLWRREVKLEGYALIVNWDQANGDAELEGYLSSFVKTAEGPIIVMASDRVELPAQSVYTAVVEVPTPEEQRLLWSEALGRHTKEKERVINKLVSQFSLTTANIHNATASAQIEAEPARLERDLWQACRIQARPRLDALCQRIEAKETWDDLVLPEEQKQILQMIIAHNRERATVYEDWGFSNKSSRGLGTSALFSGQSGTGKTMAANVIAQQLNLDLYKVDLSTVVSKYIGETEKNLKRIFDAAETGGVILLFDEADAIFGKRSEVKDARDRYANMEVSYLLQRMESYRGLAILTTNMKDNIDKAFLRRIRFITTFPFPDYKQRYEIWQKVFPTGVPTKGLDYFKLADLDAAGGNIRSIALSAAFLAASEKDEEDRAKRGSVTMERILRAARMEFSKMDQPLPLAKPQSWLEEE